MSNKILLLSAICLLGLTSCGGGNPKPSGTFTITWKNYDGTILETDKDVKAGETPQFVQSMVKAYTQQLLVVGNPLLPKLQRMLHIQPNLIGRRVKVHWKHTLGLRYLQSQQIKLLQSCLRLAILKKFN